MAQDVLITPASGLIEFYETAGNLEASIQLDNSNNLVITGNVTLGDAGADIIIGDGVSAANVIFEQGGAIYGLATKTLTLGTAGSFLSLAANITSGANITGNVTAVGNITGNYFIGNGSLLTGISGGGSVGGTFPVIARSGTITVVVASGFFDVGTRNSGVLKVAVA
jgi:hypothetical protein